MVAWPAIPRPIAEPIAEVLDRLQRAWGAVSHLNAVANTPEIRDAYNGNLPGVTAFQVGSAARPGGSYSEVVDVELVRSWRTLISQESRHRPAAQ